MVREKPVTLSDIATRLNYSTVTISKALRDHPDIAPKTIKLIRSIANEMGYTPNLMARNLSARRSNTIGVVVPKIAHFFFGSIIESIYDVAFKHNYEIILTVSQENAERERKHIQTLMAMKVDGIIISISQETKDYEIFETVRKRGVPLVFMDRIPKIKNICTVRVNDREGAFKAIDHAINLGYKKIAHFAGYNEINIGKERYQGFADAMKKHNIPINKSWVFRGGFGESYGYDSFMKLYKENNLPDLIFTVTYPVALGVYMAAREVNLRIPEDIDIICFGNAKVQNFLSPPLSCVNQPTEQLAAKSMEILLENINNMDEFECKEMSISTDLILRGTCIKFNKS
ncbi:MAG: LacI family transcriptional regulator [Bacteroidetes bacterium]|nr:LacI family transcriptional regulator [Bacteroidota bacterium]MBU1680426.1 LacI family transcriptional regulator [Bacteroidota bacterium]MBU2506293.1 LacI family transcriptional regulator [Bacteroidota bacterium]